MRTVFSLLAVAAVSSVALASSFSVPTQPVGTQLSAPAANTDGQSTDLSVTASVPAPGSAVVAIAGAALLSRRRREK
ncbi:MAG: MYXO-CTERM sorting domain-containing protein [Phycisphaerales bacterium]|nr:hypothetical protein [Planctomycetota bacterium]